MERKWIFPKDKPDLTGKQEEGIHPVLQGLLESRGIKGTLSMREFLAGNPQLTYDPFEMKDMRKAAERILAAVQGGRQICIYGDYDADGVCACSLLLEILHKLSARVFYYIPSRFEEGYGLNKEAISSIKKRGADMLVTVDCGSVSFAEVEHAKEIGLEVIVTDHHNLGENEGNRSPSTADCLLVNPKQESCNYPDPNLSGCGVAFKLAQALQRLEMEKAKPGVTSRITKRDLTRVLDLVAIATIGDIVPLTGENRTLVKYGLKVINGGGRLGLTRLIAGAGLKIGDIKSENVAYVIVPHLNAAGRLLSADTAVTLLTSEKEEEIQEAVEALLENNKERRKIQEDMTKKAIEIVERDGRDDEFFLIYAPFAHEGIAGIVAGKIKDIYYRPAILVTPAQEGLMKGTGRSIEGLDLYRLLSASRELFLKFGGHEGACGFLMEEDSLPLLKESLENAVREIRRREPDKFIPRLFIDGELEEKELTLDLARELEQMAPFGQKNPTPVFCLRKTKISGVTFLGDRKQHVRFRAGGIECILFNKEEEHERILLGGAPVDVAGALSINRWNDKEKIQFVISDLQ